MDPKATASGGSIVVILVIVSSYLAWRNRSECGMGRMIPSIREFHKYNGVRSRTLCNLMLIDAKCDLCKLPVNFMLPKAQET